MPTFSKTQQGHKTTAMWN